jgi:hypothetical protein
VDSAGEFNQADGFEIPDHSIAFIFIIELLVFPATMFTLSFRQFLQWLLFRASWQWEILACFG